MAIEIVDLAIKNGDFPYLCKRLPEGNSHWNVQIESQWKWTDGYDWNLIGNVQNESLVGGIQFIPTGFLGIMN